MKRPQQQATWTRGPSLPSINPAATAKGIVRVLTIRVPRPKYPCITKPDSIVFTLRQDCYFSVKCQFSGTNSNIQTKTAQPDVTLNVNFGKRI